MGMCQGLACCLALLVCLIMKERIEMKIAITAIAAFAGAATAAPYFTAANGYQATNVDTAGAALATVTIDISGVNNWDLQLDSDNELLSQFIAGDAHIVGLGWDVSISTVGESWLSEPVIDLGGAIFLTTGVGNDFGGTASFSSGGLLDLVGTGLDFFLAADGLLNIEFFESFDDVADAIDSSYGQGSTIQIQYVVPAPGALAMLGLGGLVAGRRRR